MGDTCGILCAQKKSLYVVLCLWCSADGAAFEALSLVISKRANIDDTIGMNKCCCRDVQSSCRE